jgi:hypothetical protein
MKTALLLLATSVLLVLTLQAADPVALKVKPGLWETTVTTDLSGIIGPSAEALAKLPPEQRARAEEVLKNARGPRTVTAQSCLTESSLKDAFREATAANRSCKNTIITSTSTLQEMKLECSNQGTAATGTLRIQAIDAENVKGSLQFDTAANGRGAGANTTFTSRWLGASCEGLSGKKAQ